MMMGTGRHAKACSRELIKEEWNQTYEKLLALLLFRSNYSKKRSAVWHKRGDAVDRTAKCNYRAIFLISSVPRKCGIRRHFSIRQFLLGTQYCFFEYCLVLLDYSYEILRKFLEMSQVSAVAFCCENSLCRFFFSVCTREEKWNSTSYLLVSFIEHLP